MERHVLYAIVAMALGVVTHSSGAIAQDIAPEVLNAPERSTPVAPSTAKSNVQISLDSLSDSEERRLNHYASRIFSAVGKLTPDEIDGTIGEKSTAAINRDTLRFVNTALGSGLKIDGISRFLGDYETENYAGPVPLQYKAPDGSFNVSALVFGSLPNANRPEEEESNYLDEINSAGQETLKAVTE